VNLGTIGMALNLKMVTLETWCGMMKENPPDLSSIDLSSIDLSSIDLLSIDLNPDGEDGPEDILTTCQDMPMEGDSLTGPSIRPWLLAEETEDVEESLFSEDGTNSEEEEISSEVPRAKLHG